MICTSEFQDYASTWVCAIGVGSNLILLFVIYTISRTEARGSRRILTIISLFNIYFSIVIKVVNPTYLLDERGFITISKTFVNITTASKIGLALFVNGFGQSLSLLMIHCFYRYVKITGKYRCMIEKKRGILALISWHFFISWAVESTCLISMQPSELRRMLSYAETKEFLNITLTPDLYYYGPVFSHPDESGIEQYDWKMVSGTVVALCVFTGLYGTTCITGIKLYSYVKNNTTRGAVQRFQLQLLLLLLAQAVSPFIFEFAPAIVILIGGTTGIVPHHWGICSPLFLGGYSGCDAILALLLFKVYRRRTIEILKLHWWPRHRSKIFQGGTIEAAPMSGALQSVATPT